MGGSSVPCPPDPNDPCKSLADKINELINAVRQNVRSGTKGLKQRFDEQIHGTNGPGTPEWENHDNEITRQQRAVRDRLNDFNSQNCGDKVPLPADAWEWATKPAPSPGQWVPPAASPSMSSDPSFMKRMEEATGLTGAALILYLIVSEGSRLFPPRNLVPVP